jgi:hypothetical protein
MTETRIIFLMFVWHNKNKIKNQLKLLFEDYKRLLRVINTTEYRFQANTYYTVELGLDLPCPLHHLHHLHLSLKRPTQYNLNHLSDVGVYLFPPPILYASLFLLNSWLPEICLPPRSLGQRLCCDFQCYSQLKKVMFQLIKSYDARKTK